MKYKILLLAAILVSLGCLALIPRVNINSDMTKYLPDDSPMKKGLETMNAEFDLSSMPIPEVRIMTDSRSGSADSLLAVRMGEYEGVGNVSIQEKDGKVLYELVVAQSTDQKKLARQIARDNGIQAVIQTAQDSSTPDPMALLLGVGALIIILFIMSRSWLEPLLFLATLGMAVVVNVGTNAFMESVSITTTSIVAVLQLVLSMDYSIILMNRYRREMDLVEDKRIAMSRALHKATPAILSSSITTMVGLMMLAFMRLKIGADLGFVLAKGVLCSLIYVYAALPGLILIFEKAIVATMKPIPMFPTDGIARFSNRFKLPLSILFVIIIAGSYILHNRTRISFSMTAQTEIDSYFPRSNQMILLYDNADESAICDVIEHAESYPEVEMAISYPSLMLRQQTAKGMLEMLTGLSPEASGMLSEDMVRLVYAAADSSAADRRLSFPQLVQFIRKEAADSSSMVAGFIDPSMMEKFALLDALATPEPKASASPSPEPAPEPAPTATPASKPDPCPEETETPTAAIPAEAPAEAVQGMEIRRYAVMLHDEAPSEQTEKFLSLTDIKQIEKPMSPEEMSSFMNAPLSQTRMVYSLGKARKSGMTPLAFTHFLIDDLFQKESLSSMVREDEKASLKKYQRIMESAASAAKLPIDELESLAAELGINPMDKQIAQSSEMPEAAEVAEMIQTEQKEMPSENIPVSKSMPEPTTRQAPATDRRLDTIMELMYSGRSYSATKMSRKFSDLGEPIDPELVSLLYAFYDARNGYDESRTMNLEEFTGFIGDRIMDNPLFVGYIDDGSREAFRSMSEMTAQLRNREHSIAVLISSFPDESDATEAFVHDMQAYCDNTLEHDHSFIGESVMFCEMKGGFKKEMLLVTILTILAIFTIVAITLRAPLTAGVLVMTVMSGVFINIAASGLGGGSVFYLAYVIVQSILMGAAIDYAILFATHYRESRKLETAYRESIQTIMTSGLIITCVPGIMALFLNDAMIRPIVSSLSAGAFAAVGMIVFVMPAVLATIKFR